jgi:putative methyltransferase (TIGR04325 family)
VGNIGRAESSQELGVISVKQMASAGGYFKHIVTSLLAAPPAITVVGAATRIPGVAAALRKNTHFPWIFSSFEDVRKAAALKHRKFGHDHLEAAEVYLRHMGSLMPSDYPILFWLRSMLRENGCLFDYGGHIGLQFYNYARYLKFPKSFRWVVCDVPAATCLGETLAKDRRETRLSFTNQFQDCEGADILLASGSLQYIETPLSALLAALKRKPWQVLVNRIPLTDQPEFVTVQDIGAAVCPYAVRNRKAFLASIEDLGYRLRDAWEVPHLSLEILLHPELWVPAYSGLYLELGSD